VRATVAAALLLFVLQALTSSTPDDFAYGARIEVEGEAPVYELELPASVYQGVTRSDLGDLRVFNGAGEAVPAVLRTAAAGSLGARIVALPVFPLFAAPGRAPSDLSVEVETRDDGAVVRVRRAADPTAVATGYLLDAAALDRPIEALHLQLADSEGDLISRLHVEASRDLFQWRDVTPGATVARLAYDQHRLQQTTIELPGVRERYLRLRWQEPDERFALLGVTAELRPVDAEPARRWRDVEGSQAPGPGRVFLYDTGGRFPVDRIRIVLPANALVSAVVSSRASAADPWQPRHRGIHYRLRIEGADLSAAAVALAPIQDRYWRVEVQEGSYAGTLPTLQIGWTPHRLAFLAAGTPPYLLAYGSARVAAAPAPLDGVLAALGTERGSLMLRPARLGEAAPLGGESRLLSAPVPVDWKRLGLWGVLLGGVAVLALMSWRLRGQLAEDRRQGGDA
jgi:hypothetical protein